MLVHSYVSRQHVKDTSKHVILGTQQFKPNEFAAQINLNMDNAWGILRCVVDTCMKLKEGKYLIMKDPNKVRILLSLFFSPFSILCAMFTVKICSLISSLLVHLFHLYCFTDQC